MKTPFIILSCLLIIFCLIALNLDAQNIPFKIKPYIDKSTPAWARMMYGNNPDVAKVVAAYENYYRGQEEEKNIHTRNYEKWITEINQVNTFGNSNAVATKRTVNLKAYYPQSNRQNNSNGWQLVGPVKTKLFNETGETGQWQANVYCVSNSLNNPDLVIAGTEIGGAYKSINRGETWTFMTPNLPIPHIYDVLIHPEDDNIFYVAGRTHQFYEKSVVYKSIDQGNSWSEVIRLDWKTTDNYLVL